MCVYRLAARGLTGRKGKRNSVGVAESSSEDGNESPPPPLPHTPHPSPAPGGGPASGHREEISDRISKEKQKFFRSSAFYAVRQGGVGLRGVRKTSSSSSSSSSISSNSDSEPECNVLISTTLFSKQTSVTPSLPSNSESLDFRKQDSKLGLRCINNSELKALKKCDINASDQSNIIKDIVKDVKQAVKSKDESCESVPARCTTSNDQCSASHSSEHKPTETDDETTKSQSTKLETLTTVAPVFSNLSKSSILDSQPSTSVPQTSKTVNNSSPRTVSPTKSPCGSSAKSSLKPGGNMSSLISSLSNSYLSKSSLSSSSAIQRSEKSSLSYQSSVYDMKEKPWGFAAAAALKKTEIFSLDKSGGSLLPTRCSDSKQVVPSMGSSLKHTLRTSVSSTSSNLHLASTLNTPLGSPLIKPIPSMSSTSSSSLKLSMAYNVNRSLQRSGFGQLKGLFDGLSHLFSTPALSRFRTGANAPNYNPGRRKPRIELPKRKQKSVINEIKAIKKVPKTVLPSVEVKQPVSFSQKPHVRKTSTPLEEKYLSPSFLVKTAANAKRHESERRRIFKEEGPHIVSDSMMRFHEKQALKRDLIAEATQAHHHQNHHPVPPIPPQTVRPAVCSGKKLPVPPLSLLA